MHSNDHAKSNFPKWASYTAAAYLVFWFMIIGICGTASMVFHAPPVVMRILSNVCAWSPTFVLFCMFRKLMPEITVKDFLRRSFSGKISAGLLLLCIVSVTGIFLISAAILAAYSGKNFHSLFSAGAYPVWISIIFSLTSGPTGEELGWRGYLRGELEERFGFLKGNFLLGIIWTFWHTVLWFVDSNFTSGWQMAVYIASNIIVMTSINFIMAVFLRKSGNLIYAVLIHFCFNLPYCFLDPDIRFYIIMSLLYACTAAVFIKAFRKNLHNSSEC